MFLKHPAGPLFLKDVNIWGLGYHHNWLGYFILPDNWQGIQRGQAKPSYQIIYKGQKEFVKKAFLRMEWDLNSFRHEFAKEWANRQSLWPGKRGGAELFEISLIRGASDLIKFWQNKVVNEQLTFSTFSEIRKFAELIADDLPKDHLYPPKTRKNTFQQHKLE